MRNHGFERPYNTMQLATWVLLPVLLLHFLFFASPVLPIGASVPCTILYVALGMVSAYLAYKCCITDPIDSKLACHLRKQAGGDVEGGHNNEEDNDDDDPTKYCWVCQTDVHDKSMHCKFCDKCVTRFDHHCMWLNTCVGEANYLYFFRTVVATFWFVVADAAILGGIVIAYFVQAYGESKGGAQVDRMENWFGAGVPMVVAIVNIVFLVINIGSAFLIGQLLFFHIGLRKKDVTTYEYIVKENQRKRDKSKMAMQIRSKRMIMTRAADAKRDRNMKCRLQMGRLCVPCDPARRAVLEDNKREEEDKARREMTRRNEEDEEDDKASRSSSLEPENNANERGFKEEEEEAEVIDGTDTSVQEAAHTAAEHENKAPLHEAMATRKSGLEGSAASAGEQTGKKSSEPQFIGVEVTECTHPSASSASAPTNAPRVHNNAGANGNGTAVGS